MLLFLHQLNFDINLISSFNKLCNSKGYCKYSKQLINYLFENFPHINVKFVEGKELIKKYPKGGIPLGDHDKFFS